MSSGFGVNRAFFEKKYQMVIYFLVFLVFHFAGFFLMFLSMKTDWKAFAVGLLVAILCQKYIKVFHLYKCMQDTELKIQYPNHELSVNEAIERQKDIERRKRENSKWYEFWKWS